MNNKINRNVNYLDLGLIDYQEAWDFQEFLFKRTIEKKLANRDIIDSLQEPTPNHLIFCEHPHVYTLGKSGSVNHLLLNEEGLKENGVSFYRINRGGDITYHGPGQIVAYPILDLDNFFTDIHRYLRTLEEAVIKTIALWGIQGHRLDKLTGVWIRNDDAPGPNNSNNYSKICAFGVRASRWVTMHGLALNVTSDMAYFDHIVPCGIADHGVTSMDRLLPDPPDMDKVMEALKKNLAQAFGMELQEPRPNGWLESEIKELQDG